MAGRSFGELSGEQCLEAEDAGGLGGEEVVEDRVKSFGMDLQLVTQPVSVCVQRISPVIHPYPNTLSSLNKPVL